MSLERLEVLRHEMKKCVRCSLCKLVPMPTIQQTKFTSACPPVDEYHFHAYSGGGIQVMALALLDGRITIDRDLAQIVSACTTCGLCDVACKFIMAAERQDVILALKECINDAGFSPVSKAEHKSIDQAWMDGMKLKTLPESKSDVLLWVGAGAKYDLLHSASAQKLAQLLQSSHTDFAIFPDEPESGIEYFWTGQHELFENQVRQVVDRLNNSNPRVIVTLCGEDLGMFRAKYPRLGYKLKPKVIHASEFLLHLIQKRKLHLVHPINEYVTYHDPCYLGRQSEPPLQWHGEERQTYGVMRYFVPPKPINYGGNGVFDPPRQLLRSIPGLQLNEMFRIREYAYCCGGGGGVPDAHPEVARSAATQRMDEARAVGASMLVTSCQHCRQNFLHWQDGNSIPVVDLVDLVYEASGFK